MSTYYNKPTISQNSNSNTDNIQISDATLQWKDFNVKRSKDNVDILKNIYGELHASQSLAIIGGSGAGKTTFLNYLSMKSSKKGLNKVSGESKLVINGLDETTSLPFLSSYVPQDDLLLSYMTPYELLKFAADLRLPSLSEEDKIKVLDTLIANLDLSKCKDTKVGTVEKKGLSGGERKRTAIGYELITNPKILFLDEPTTGLDVVSARNVVEVITKEARLNNRIVIFTIHQPSTEIFYLFDKLMVMASGRNIYYGRADKGVSYFEKLGYPCNPRMNPAEFFISAVSQQNMKIKALRTSVKASPKANKERQQILDEPEKQNSPEDDEIAEGKKRASDSYSISDVSIEELEEDNENDNFEETVKKYYLEEIERINIKGYSLKKRSTDNEVFDSDSYLNEHQKLLLTEFEGLQKNKKVIKVDKNSFFKEFLILFNRHLLGIKRDPANAILRMAMAIVNALFVIITFCNLGNGENAYIDRTACLFYITNICVSVNMQVNLLIMLSEKLYFYKDTDSQLYSVGTYLSSKTIMEIPLAFISSILVFLVVYFACGLNTEYFTKYLMFILIYGLSGLTSGLLSIILSIIVDDIQIAPAILPFFIFTQALAGGYYIKIESLPVYFKPFYYISIYRYTFQSLTYNEFVDLPDKECHDPIKCKDPLSEFHDSFFMSVFSLFIYSLINIFLCYVCLKIKTILRLSLIHI